MLLTYVDPITQIEGLNWLGELNVWSIVIRLLFCIFFAGLIGAERAIKRHAAGFRTYILVCVGSAIVMMTNQFILLQFNVGDPARFGAQVISGIGFLGAGTIIINSKSHIKGLTTAAALWACACVGLSIGVGFYTAALLGFVLTLIVLIFLPPLENMFTGKARLFEVQIEVKSKEAMRDIVYMVRDEGYIVHTFTCDEVALSTGMFVYCLLLEESKETKKIYKTHGDLLAKIKELDSVIYIQENL